ncbi:MAG: hypothetical protein A2W35_15425 [Chloroflexi bacterium RBG_16_57_11]|nr:MAG: hypothetical protein A2W35_15425 [Chloroflexi bacterium RBG_16_57_11]
MPAVIEGTKFAVIGGEVGCITLVIVLLAVFGGLWLDDLLGTRPLFTVGLVLASAPISLVLTFWVARRAINESNKTSRITRDPSNLTEGEKTGE